MKFSTALFVLALAPTIMGSSGDASGEDTVIYNCGGGELEVNCEWSASASRKLRSRRVKVGQNRWLGMDVDDVECEATFAPDDGGDDIECSTEVEGRKFMCEEKDVSDHDDFYVFTVEGVTFDCPGFEGITVELELELEDVDGTATYDDEALKVSGCATTVRS